MESPTHDCVCSFDKTKYNNDNKSDGDWIRDLNFKRRSVWPVLRVHSFYWANCGCEP